MDTDTQLESSAASVPYVNQSETSRHRSSLQGYCAGYGIDIGFGGDAVTDSAIRIDFPHPYASTGTQSVQLGGDCRDLYWLRDDSLDYVYSSHVLEDFDERETEPVMREWVRVLKPGGKLILLLPDQQRYAKFCVETCEPYNEHHSIEHFSLDYVECVAQRLGNLTCVARHPQLGRYSFAVVFAKTAAAGANAGGANATGGSETAELRDKLMKAWAERDDLKLRLNRIERHPLVLAWSGCRRALCRARRMVARSPR